MENYQAMLSKIKNEHMNIRENLKLVGDSMNDHEVLGALSGAQADWAPGNPDILSKKQERLQQNLAVLSEGLHNHFLFEMKNLSPFAGKIFILAISSEHREIEKQLDEAVTMAADLRLEGLSQQELLSEERRVQQTINSLGYAIEDHSAREEVLFEMLEKGLQENGRI